jgi:D-xylose transport system substrate-binding protein
MSDDFDLRLRKELQALADAVPIERPQASMPHGRSARGSDLPIVTRVRAGRNTPLGLGAALVALVVVLAAGLAVWGGRRVTPASSPTLSSPTTAATSTPGPHRSGCLVGELWNNYTEERFGLWDGPAIEKQVLAAGDDYDWVDAKSNQETQVAQIDEFVAKGAKVIVLRAQGDGDTWVPPATLAAIDRATAAGVAVIAYDYPADSPKVLTIRFDEAEIGRAEARAMLVAKPKGNYVIIRGPQGYWDSRFYSGIQEVLQPAIDKGDIKIVAESYTPSWDPAYAQDEMKSILAANGNNVDAVIAMSDGMASGAVAALKEVGLAGKVAVAGQGGDLWNLKHVADGTQTIDVWRDYRLMGKTAGDAAVELCKNPDISKVTGATLFTPPGHSQTWSILLKPEAITKDNLNVVLDSGMVTKADLCDGIDPAEAPPACR